MTYACDINGNLTAQQGTGAFTVGTPAYCAVPGKAGAQQAMDFSSATRPWGTQSVLTPGSTQFSIAFRAKLGSTANGLLFAFGCKQGTPSNGEALGGMTFRRTNVAGEFIVEDRYNSNGDANQWAHYVNTNQAGVKLTDDDWFTCVLTYGPADTAGQSVMRLYINGILTTTYQAATTTNFIKTEFQFGSRHSGLWGAETGGSGAIDAIAAWDGVQLTAEEAAAVAAEWNVLRLPTDTPRPEGLTYYSDLAGSLDTLDGTGAFTLGSGSASPHYVAVPGKGENQAMDFSVDQRPWGDVQTALPTDAKTFTVAFRAKLGTANNGILFAFGTKSNQEGGLSFRRGNATDSFVVATGSNHSEGRPAYTFTSPTLGAGSYDKGWHTYILTCAPANDSQVTMTLYVDGLQCDQETMANPTHLIKPQFQFGTRHATAFDGEAAGNGAIDTFAMWTAALTADEAKTLTEMWDRVPPNFDEAIPALPSGVADILSLGTLAPLSGTTDVRHFSLEQWAPARQGNINAALITGSAVDWVNLYGIFDGSTSFSSTEKNPLERSTWMKVTGGKYNRIVGGRTNGHAATIAEGSGNGADSVKGDFNVQLSGPDTTARNLIGGFYGTGDGYNNDAGGAAGKPRSLWGDTSVVVSDGAFVTGGIVGGSVVRFVAKDSTFTHTGNSSVTVHSVLAAPVMDDVHNVTPAGVKPMGIVGGDLNVDIGSLEPRGSEITGSTSVTVDIPEASGTFSMPIYGASVRATAGKAAQESFTQKVGGTSTVTIDAPNVTFDSKIVAGGSGKSVSVGDKATLQLIAGRFTGATLLPSDQGATAASSDLFLGEEYDETLSIDLSDAAAIGDFTTMTVAANVGLGEHRLPNTKIVMDMTVGQRTITFNVTDSELQSLRSTDDVTGATRYDQGSIVLAKAEGRYDERDFTWNVETPAPRHHKWAIAKDANNNLCITLERDPNLVWEQDDYQEGQPDAWMEGLPDFVTGDNVTFNANKTGAETVDIGNKAYTLGKVSFTGGAYTFAGTGSLTTGATTANGATLTVETTVDAGNTTLTGTDLTVSGGATLTADTLSLDGAFTLHLGDKPYTFRYVKWVPTERVAGNADGNGGGIALAEFRFLLNGEPVEWGEGATVSISRSSGSTHSSNHTVDHLIDGQLSDVQVGGTWQSHNWFLSMDNTVATINPAPEITFDAGAGKAFAFDGYQLGIADQTGRNPTAWTLQGSNDNSTWTVLDTKDYTDDQAKAWTARSWAPAETLPYRGGVTARYVRWSPRSHSGGGGNAADVGLAEIQLLLNGEPVAWDGATVLEPYKDTSVTSGGTPYAGNFSGNKDNLIDGSLDTYWTVRFNHGNHFWEGRWLVSVTIDAGEGKAFTFDAYRLASMGPITSGINVPCVPAEWKLEVSDNGTDWTLVDFQGFSRQEAWEILRENNTVRTDWLPHVFQAGAALHAPLTTTAAGARIAGSGLIDGAVTLAPGTVIDASQVAVRGAFSTTAMPSVSGDGVVTILPPEDFVGDELRLLAWPGWVAGDESPAAISVDHFTIDNATAGSLPCYDLESRASGLYLVNKTVICDPWDVNLGDTTKTDHVPAELYDTFRDLATQEGKREVHVVAYTRGNQALAKRWASVYAPQVFQGEGLLEFAQDGDRDILKVSYEFGISRLWISTDPTGVTQVNVTATLSSPDGTTGDLTFVPGSIVRLRAESTQTDGYGNATYIGTALATEEIDGEGVHEVTFTIPYANLESVMANANFKGLRVDIATSAGK